MMPLRSRLPALGLVLLAAQFTLSAPAALANAELNAKPGGKVKIVNGTPTWRDEFAAEMKNGLNWRLGSDGPTTLTTEAGLVFGDLVLFPGEYNLGLVCEGEDAFKLVIHHDGQNWKGGACEGKVPLQKSAVSGKDVAKQLQLDFPKDPARKGGYLFELTFGPHRMQGAFTSAKAKSVSGKSGKTAFKAVYLERTDLAELGKTLEESGCAVARIERKDAKPLTLILDGGEKPSLTIAPEGQTSGETLDGKPEAAAKPSTALTLALGDGQKGCKATFTVGQKAYVFEIPEAALGAGRR